MQTYCESDLKKANFVLPQVPLKVMGITAINAMNKREKDKLKKKQENLDKCLEILQIEDMEFYATLRDEPTKVRKYLDTVLMRRMTEAPHEKVVLHEAYYKLVDTYASEEQG